MKRSFWSVGQGAFYTESFHFNCHDYRTVVYDCGVSGSPDSIIASLQEHYRMHGNIIDIVFISHFHSDHISHIPYLLRYFSVGAIVLPVISPEAAVDAYLNNYLAEAQNIDNNISLIEKLLSGSTGIGTTKVIRVAPVSSERERVADRDNIISLDERVLSDLPDHCIIGPNTIIRINGWEYVPCNFPCAKSSELIVKMKMQYPELLEVLLRQNWIEARALLEKIPFEDIKKLYKECFLNDENEESMTVLSRPENDDFHPSTSCLYTGDSPFRNNRRLEFIKHFYGSHWERFGTFQVPHHGADDDNPKELYDKHRTCVVCYSTINRYGHPGKQTLMNMAQAKCNIRLVTEEKASSFVRYLVG